MLFIEPAYLAIKLCRLVYFHALSTAAARLFFLLPNAAPLTAARGRAARAANLGTYRALCRNAVLFSHTFHPCLSNISIVSLSSFSKSRPQRLRGSNTVHLFSSFLRSFFFSFLSRLPSSAPRGDPRRTGSRPFRLKSLLPSLNQEAWIYKVRHFWSHRTKLNNFR